MRSLISFVTAAIFSISLAAQQTGKFSGKVTDTAGKPILNAVLVLKRMDVSFTKEIKVNARGNFSQVGLYPTNYELTVSAEGYVGIKEIVKIPLGDILSRNIILKTVEEATSAAAQQQDIENPGAASANSGAVAFRDAAGYYNENNYAEAMSRFSSAIEHFNDVIIDGKAGTSRTEAEEFLPRAINYLAFCQYEVGKADAEQRNELWLKAEPILLSNFEKITEMKSQERARLASYLSEISKMKGDAQAEKKYNDILEEIEGPKAENAYNIAVPLFNAGKLSQAIPHLKKAIEINPEFADTYYLLAICVFGEGDMKGAKENLQKYLKLAPNGKYAAEVKEMLADF